MTIQGQDNSLTFVQGHSDPNFLTSFPKITLGCLKPNGACIRCWYENGSNHPGHMTKMALMPIYGKNLQNIASEEPKCR